MDDYEKSYLPREQVGMKPGRDMLIINEPGLYSLVLRSRVPMAKEFKRWVTHEVLPQIRKTGGYIPIKQEGSNEEFCTNGFSIGDQVERMLFTDIHINPKNGGTLMRNLLALGLMIIVVSGCALTSPTPYQPDTWRGGYSDTQLTEDTFKVWFAGNAFIHKFIVEDYTLLRCSEVSQEYGYPYFKLMSEKDYMTVTETQTPAVAFGTVSPSGNGLIGVGVKTGGETQKVEKPATCVIMICHREKPEGFYYDAKLVETSIKKQYKLN